MQENTKLWIEAAKILATNPTAKVSCPVCKIGTLNVKDESFGNDKIDRYMLCDSCGQHNVLTIIKKTIVDIQEDPFD